MRGRPLLQCGAQHEPKSYMALIGKIRTYLSALSLCAVGSAMCQFAYSQPRQATAAATESPAPVTVDGRTLLLIHERMLSFSPEERAKAISERIEALANQPPAPAPGIHASDYENTTQIVSGDLIIMAVTDSDAKSAGKSRQDLARDYTQVIQSAVEALRREYSFRTIAIGAVYTALTTLAFLLILAGLRRLGPRIRSKLDAFHGSRVYGLRIQSMELLTAQQLADGLMTLFTLVRTLVILVGLYYYLSAVFSFFPWTRGYATVLLNYSLLPVYAFAKALLDHVQDFLFIVVVIFIARYLIKLVKLLFKAVGNESIKIPGFFPYWAEPTYRIAHLTIIALTAAAVVPSFPGARSPAFQGISIFVGVVFSLSSTSAISNVIAGFVLTYTRGFQTGDRVQIGDTLGDILETTSLVTRIRTIKNVDVSIPNSLVLNSHIVNFSSCARTEGLILHTTITIGYDAPWMKVHELLIEAALATDDILREPRPFVFQTSLDNSYVSYQINGYTDQPNRMITTYSHLHQNIQDKFNRGGIEILSPSFAAIRDGNQTTIPKANLDPNYVADGFRIRSINGTRLP